MGTEKKRLNTTLQEDSQSMTFEEIYQQYSGRILNLAYRMTHREDAARDLTQDVFIKVYEHLSDFEGKSQIYTWIYRIAVNHILNHLKKNQRLRWLNLMDKNISELFKEEDIDPTFWGRNGVPSPESHLEKLERERIVHAQVQSLPVKYRVPLMLHRYERMSYQEVADVMQLSLSAVETRIHRAKKELIKKLEPWMEYL